MKKSVVLNHTMFLRLSALAVLTLSASASFALDWPNRFEPIKTLTYAEGRQIESKMYLRYNQSSEGVGKNDPDIAVGQIYKDRTVADGSFTLESEDKITQVDGDSGTTYVSDYKIIPQVGPVQTHQVKRKFVKDSRPYRGYVEGVEAPFLTFFKGTTGDICVFDSKRNFSADNKTEYLKDTQEAYESRWTYVIGNFKMADGKRVQALLKSYEGLSYLAICDNGRGTEQKSQTVEITTADLIPLRSVYSPSSDVTVYKDTLDMDLKTGQTRHEVYELLTAPARKIQPNVLN